MTEACQTVRTPGASVSLEDHAAIVAASEATGLARFHLAWLGLHALACWPYTPKEPRDA